MTIDQALSIFNLTERTEEQLVKAWKDKLKQYHPDVNPHGLEMSKLVNQAHDFLMENLNVWTRETYETKTPEGFHLDEEINKVYQGVKMYPEIELNLAGCWLWITGNTKPIKDNLKDLGCRWAKKKSSWYWRPEGQKKRFHSKPLDMDTIYQKYGKTRLETEERTAI